MSKTFFCEIYGTVQGVGFRPFVYKLALKNTLVGWIQNNSDGVKITVTGDEPNILEFFGAIQSEKPPLSHIEKFDFFEVVFENFDEFSIIHSQNEHTKTALLPPDVSICQECEAELFDPNNKRYLYPFISCTNCGVRYTMIESLPYDRCNTSMDEFSMCEACKKEYENPLNRRYYAQTIGCFDCGPKLYLYDNNLVQHPYEFTKIIEALHNGKILALKGVGGYHLICDAANDAAVLTLRNRKNRPSKPFAIMVKDMQMAQNLAFIDANEEQLLTSNAKPIVLLQTKSNAILSQYISPKVDKIGLFLPYTPLHLLILRAFNKPIVATSANLSDEPLASDFEAIAKMNLIWDLLVEHDRKIINGCDDSVVFSLFDKTHFIRRARGYAPSAIKLHQALPQNVLAVGANQKSTVAIGFGNSVILSPHIGDLDGIKSVEYFEQNIQNLGRIYDFSPDVIVCDKHPNYESTKWAKKQSAQLIQVQHHYAHILGVLAEQNIKNEVLGVAFDGTGYGDDGAIWGGEFFVASLEGYERVGHLKYFRLLGGDKAIKEPRRVALGLLFDVFGAKALELQNPTTEAFSPEEKQNLYLMWQKGLNSPLTSSSGRLFDAVASLLGILQNVSYEGEAGLIMESLYDESVEGAYSIEVVDGVVELSAMIEALLSESDAKVAVSRFFNTLINIIEYFAILYKLPLVCSGGVFQNKVLCKLLIQRKLNATFAYNTPANDGGIALGQVASLIGKY